MPPSHFDKQRVAPGAPDREQMADGANRQPDQPEAQAKSKGCRQRAIDDGERAWRAADSQASVRDVR